MYEYLIGCLILFIIWMIGFILRKDLRKPMIWSGIMYAFVMGILFILIKFFQYFGLITQTIVPGYWSPDTLFNLTCLTGGYGIEDGIFMFLVGGIAIFVYEYFCKKRIKIKKNPKHHIKAIVIALVLAILFGLIFDFNLIYTLIIFGLVGAICMWIERKDLIKHSLFGGLSFMIIYFIAFFVFNTIFPNFIAGVYNFENLSNILIFTVPIEELLYASSFGLMWAPIYEYEHGEKDIEL
jgi:hypothetical protein